MSARPMSEARRRHKAACRRRRRRVDESEQSRCSDLVHALASEHGLAKLDLSDGPLIGRRCMAKLFAAMASRPAEAGITEAAGATIRAVAGESFVAEGLAALNVATLDPDDVRDELAARFPAWSPDVVRIALALEPDLVAIWEAHRRAAPEHIDLEGYPSWPALDLPEPDQGDAP